MLDKYIIKKLLSKSKIFLIEYCLENNNNSVNSYFLKKSVGLLLDYKIKYFPLLMSHFRSQEYLSKYLSKNVNFVLVKIDLVYIKNQLMLNKYIKNKFYIQQFINLLTKIHYFLYKIFNLK